MATRKIQIEFELPEKFQEDYADVCAELVFEDFFGRHAPNIGAKVIFDSAPPATDVDEI